MADGAKFRGLVVRLSSLDSEGVLHVQCVFREFGDVPSEFVAGTSVAVGGDEPPEIFVPIKAPWPEVGFGTRRVEPWLTWSGAGELFLDGEPCLLSEQA